jgi:hypothetical protein
MMIGISRKIRSLVRISWTSMSTSPKGTTLNAFRQGINIIASVSAGAVWSVKAAVEACSDAGRGRPLMNEYILALI